MADKFDPYREALIVETETEWPEEYDDWEPRERARVEHLLHQKPEQAVAAGVRADAHRFLPEDRRDAGGYSARGGMKKLSAVSRQLSANRGKLRSKCDRLISHSYANRSRQSWPAKLRHRNR